MCAIRYRWLFCRCGRSRKQIRWIYRGISFISLCKSLSYRIDQSIVFKCRITINHRRCGSRFMLRLIKYGCTCIALRYTRLICQQNRKGEIKGKIFHNHIFFMRSNKLPFLILDKLLPYRTRGEQKGPVIQQQHWRNEVVNMQITTPVRINGSEIYFTRISRSTYIVMALFRYSWMRCVLVVPL